LNELGGSLKDATARSAELNQSLKDNDASAKFSAKLNNLKNQVDIFANTNRRATESLRLMRDGQTTFAQGWQNIRDALSNGNLDSAGLQRLTEQFRNFRGEADAAGMTVSRFFQSMQSQLRMVLQRWISLYAIVGRVTSAFNELKEVDKILTEIAKSSDVTRESLQSLGESAFEMANKYGRAASDYLYGVQEFSRAGFRGDQLTGLTEISLLAQSAGDIETDLANSYVIATNAAYGLAGSQEKLGEVLDRQNYVTNNYALNMTDLANATKIAASQAAQSGVEIDQMTAALATMISTTQQGGEIAARSLRGILMNIQQVKGEVGDGEEDITAESLTKYEKAAKDLGVSLKEVKDGVAVLRDPMAVLSDLAEAFNKEADDSIKKANLINAIGGKFYLVA
jgi:TP901 family phage tail tape measure protein